MEIGVDFGLFELIGAAFLAWISRFVFRRRLLTIAFLICSAAAPLALLYFVEGEKLRWLAAACLTATAVHISTMVLLMRRYNLGELLSQSRQSLSKPQ
jgi:uncharacterized membrane protein